MADEANKTFTISVAGDSGGFLRCQCAHCGLDFKLKIESSDQQDELAWWLHQTLRDANVAAEDQNASPHVERTTCCPYCARLGPRQDFVHPETVSYIRRIAKREIIEPMLYKMFRGFGAGLRSSGPVRITVSVPSGRSPRPISGPEANDLVAVGCLDCGVTFKVYDTWRGSASCPNCHIELLAQ